MAESDGVTMGNEESALFLALAARDGARFPGLDFAPIPRGTAATAVGETIGIPPDDVLAFCEAWVGRGWYDYYEPDADAGWVTEMGKVAATYLWCGASAGSN